MKRPWNLLAPKIILPEEKPSAGTEHSTGGRFLELIGFIIKFYLL